MSIGKEHLDLRVCDVEKEATNTETFREFIVKSENEFEIIPKDLDRMSDNRLNEYLEFLDYLWTK